MVIGRTSGGKIQTKTDGGLRAVNCACCGGNPCFKKFRVTVDGVEYYGDEHPYNHSYVQCFGDETTFVESLSCNGNVFLTYEHPGSCVGTRVAWSFECTPDGFFFFSFYRDFLPVSSFNCDVCDVVQHSVCRVTENIIYYALLSFGENHIVEGTFDQHSVSVCPSSCSGYSKKNYTIRVDPL